MTSAYPLHWPAHRPKTRLRERSKFKTSFATARDQLFAELQRLGARDVVLSTNIELRLDGWPYAGRNAPQDPGVAVYFSYKGKPMCFACDRWDYVQDNMQAVMKTIEALRGIARWGSGDMLAAAFTGFTALPPPTSGPVGREWWHVLDCTPDLPLDKVETIYRAMARLAHPDATGGSTSKMAELNAAIAAARKEKSGQ
ncbi:MAG: J domain-containing protein [Alphaproteobacteria bacterium]